MDDALIVKLYGEGLSARDVAARTGVCHETVLRRVRAAGGEVRPRESAGRPVARTPEKIRRDVLIVKLYGEGMSARDVAARIGVSTTTVLQRLHAAGGEVRRRGHGRSYPPATPRPCELETCRVLFTPPANEVAAGAGRFHSAACWYAWIRGRPRSQWRVART